MIAAASRRHESRGVHFRKDFPATLPEWQQHIPFRHEAAATEPVASR
jgi:aspartate oxidase